MVQIATNNSDPTFMAERIRTAKTARAFVPACVLNIPDAWEQRKLGEFVTIISGWSPSGFVESADVDDNLFIKVDDLNSSSRVQDDSKMKVRTHSKYPKIKAGSIIFPKRGAAIMTNKVRILGFCGYMDTNMMALEPGAIDRDFLYTFLLQTGLYKIADTSTLPQINNKHIEPYDIVIPHIDEQKKIGRLFSIIDDLITLHQREPIRGLKHYLQLSPDKDLITNSTS